MSSTASCTPREPEIPEITAFAFAQEAATGSAARLITAALVGIALIVLLITRFKPHPFLALTIGSLVVAVIAGLPIASAVESFTKGFGRRPPVSAP